MPEETVSRLRTKAKQSGMKIGALAQRYIKAGLKAESEK